jgi:tetratricopeptide (TPR) repeat protein
MSLLLEALQKAARSREQAADKEPAPAVVPPDPEPVPLSAPPSTAEVAEAFGPVEPVARVEELTLEPAPRGEPLLEEEVFGDDIGSDLTEGPTPEQAATVVRAAQSSEPGVFTRMLDSVRDRPLYGVIAAAVLFTLAGSVYLYIQIANPGLLVRTPPPPEPIARAPEPLPAPKPAIQTPAPVPAPAPAPVAPIAAESTTSAALASAPEPLKVTAAPTRTSPPPPPVEKPVASTAATSMPPPFVTLTEKQGVAIESSDISKARKAISGQRKTGVAAQTSAAVPESRQVRILRAQDQITATRVAESQPAVTKPIAPQTAGLPAEISEAYQALQEGRLDQAEALYKKVAQADPRSIDALLGLGAIAWQKGTVESAALNYQRVLELDPNQPTAQAALIAIMGRADPQASEARLKQLVAREPNAFLYFALGTLYSEQGAWPAAQQAYFQAYQMQPDSPDYAFNLAVGLEHVGQQKTALTYYRKALDLSFKKGRANFDQSLAIERVGQLSARLE